MAGFTIFKQTTHRTATAKWWQRLGLCGLGLIATPILPGCAFQREWRAAQYCPTVAEGMEGLWEGTWLSHKNGHTGKLKAIITRVDGDCYQVRFFATYLAIIPFGFKMPMQFVHNGQSFQFSGEQDIGLLAGGTFTYNGWADASDFHASYVAAGDCGEFNMQRVGPVVSCCPCDQTHALHQSDADEIQQTAFEQQAACVAPSPKTKSVR